MSESAFPDYLVRTGKLDEAGLGRALRATTETGERITGVVTKLGLVTEIDLADSLCSFLDLPRLDRGDFPEKPLEIDGLSYRFLRSARIVPVAVADSAIRLAMMDPTDQFSRDAMAFISKRTIEPAVALASDIEWALDRLYGNDTADRGDADLGGGESADRDADRLRDLASEAPIIRLVDRLIGQAVERKASDIHFEAVEQGLHVRFRIDGLLQSVERFPDQMKPAVASRLKILAGLNIAERRLAQDGRIRLAVKGREMDFRVSTVPTMHGESVVLRILDRHDVPLDLVMLGFESAPLDHFRAALSRPHGIVLVTGPTGSGKTTTLYAALSELNLPDRKILTIEDPVEYSLPGINQTAVKAQIGLTFASALRSFLRQDPDIIMVGEIRDAETAQIGVQAALTGHLVLSTLHTNNAVGAVTRLLDMGVEDYLIASTLEIIVAQRLVRTLCMTCREPRTISGELSDRLDLDARQGSVHGPVGCPDCNHSGYSGRTSITEVLPVNEGIKSLIMAHAPASSLHKCAVASGMRTMFRHGVELIERGMTTPDEVLRVTLDVES